MQSVGTLNRKTRSGGLVPRRKMCECKSALKEPCMKRPTGLKVSNQKYYTRKTTACQKVS